VVTWAEKRVVVSPKNAEKLREQEIDGAHLLDLTEEKMVKLYGISGAAAVDIMKGLAKLFPPPPTAAAPGSSYSTSSSVLLLLLILGHYTVMRGIRII